MSFTFRPAVREKVGLLIGVAGPSGSGKTYSAMRLAAGMAGDKPFAVIDTEARRALHYADRFRFDHGELRSPFRPQCYTEAIRAADQAGYPVIVVDSCSHEHAGEGGLLDWHEEELTRMAGDDYRKREACKMAAWIKPKMAHKTWISQLLQVRAHLILCFRAEQKTDIVRGANGKMEIVPKKLASGFSDWIPICEKNMLYELTASFLLTPDAPGLPHAIKLQEQHRDAFPADKPISEESGRAIAAWASGGANKAPEGPPAKSAGQDVKDKALESCRTAATLAGIAPEALDEWAMAIGHDTGLSGCTVDELRDLYRRLSKGTFQPVSAKAPDFDPNDDVPDDL